MSVETRVERLTPAEIVARLCERSVVYVPIGAIEFHGPHLPVGLDALTAYGVCLSAAEYAGGVVMPPLYLGTGGEHVNYPWTLMLEDPAALDAALRSTIRGLVAQGVREVVILSGHFAGEQIAVLDAISRDWPCDGSSEVRVVATSIDRCDSSPVKPDHAGVFETLVLTGVYPELVHLEQLPNLADAPAVDPGGNAFGAHRHDTAHPLWGVFGPDPREADLALAQPTVDALVRWVATLGRANESVQG